MRIDKVKVTPIIEIDGRYEYGRAAALENGHLTGDKDKDNILIMETYGDDFMDFLLNTATRYEVEIIHANKVKNYEAVLEKNERVEKDMKGYIYIRLLLNDKINLNSFI